MSTRTRRVDRSLLHLTTETTWWHPPSSTRTIHRTQRQTLRPDPRTLLPKKHQAHPSPLRILLWRRLPPLHTTRTRCQNLSLVKTPPSNLLFRERSCWLVISSSRPSRRGSPKLLFPLKDPFRCTLSCYDMFPAPYPYLYDILICMLPPLRVFLYKFTYTVTPVHACGLEFFRPHLICTVTMVLYISIIPSTIATRITSLPRLSRPNVFRSEIKCRSLVI